MTSIKRQENKFSVSFKALGMIASLALSFGLPQIFHLCFGMQASQLLLPMYLPLCLFALILPWSWSLALGAITPSITMLLTYAVSGNFMPGLARVLPMSVETIFLAMIISYFGRKNMTNSIKFFAFIVLALLGGRVVNFVTSILMGQELASTFFMLCNGWAGLLLQLGLVTIYFISNKMVNRN